MVDLEADVIGGVKSLKYTSIFGQKFLYSKKEDDRNNFARSYYTVSKEMIDKVNYLLFELVNNCDNVQGFAINHSVEGGIGSILSALILEKNCC